MAPRRHKYLTSPRHLITTTTQTQRIRQSHAPAHAHTDTPLASAMAKDIEAPGAGDPGSRAVEIVSGPINGVL